MTRIFSEEELEQLSDEVNQQLQHLMSVVPEPSETRGDEPEDLALLPPTQADAIAQITQEPPKTFLQKFAKAAKTDLCEEGGMLYKQWQKWGDLDNKDALERIGAVLLAMGFTGGILRSLVVAVVVTIVHLGVKAFCEDYS